MKFVKQFAVILAVCLLGEILHIVLPLPVPASIYGMVLMFLALLSGVIKLHQVEATADFLVQTMPIMLVPAGIGLMARFDSLQAIWLPFLVVNLVGSFATFAATGWVSQWIMHRKGGSQN